MNSIISLFKNAYDTKPDRDIDIDMLLDFIKDGQWEYEVKHIRSIEDKDTRKLAKKKIPAVTISGKFSERNDKDIIQHSGYIAVDFDDLDDIEQFKNTISKDKYCYAVFLSISGNGLCAIFKIDGSRHREAFDGIQEYIYETYGEQIGFDSHVKNESRLRFISYDPELYYNPSSQKFKRYPKAKPIKVEKFVYVEGDLDELINEVDQRKLNICDTYAEWLRVGFSLAEKFGENGRRYFHTLSQFSGKYEGKKCDKQYTYCLNAKGEGTGIATLYYYFKKAGLTLYSKQTLLISSIASSSRKNGKSAEDVIKNIEKFEGISSEKTTDIVLQIFNNKIDVQSDESVINDIKNWIRHTYDIRLNEITLYLENKGVQVDDTFLNSIFVNAKVTFALQAPTSLMKEILFSDFISSYNPIYEFYESNMDKIPKFLPGDIPQIVLDLWDTFEVDNKQYLIEYGTKWLVSIIAASFYVRSPLMLILVGKPDVGKSEFFERLLPRSLRQYFGNPDLGSGKDLYIAMGNKWLILDDEVTGKSKKEDSMMKKLLTSPSFTLRKPYGMTQIDVKRLAVLCGTSNPDELLTDPTGNRRLLPIRVKKRNFEAFDNIDKDELFMSLYQMYIDGFDWKVSGTGIEKLTEHTEEFQNYSVEYELILKYFKRGSGMLTTADVKVFIEDKTGQKLSLNKIGQELTRIGIEKKSARIDGMPKKVWLLDNQTFDTLNAPFN